MTGSCGIGLGPERFGKLRKFGIERNGRQVGLWMRPINKRAETEAYIRGFASYLAEELEDPESYAFYERIARASRGNAALEDLIYRVLSEVKNDFRRGKVRKSKGAAFTDRLKRACLERSLPPI